jgi:hypothetical protein
MSNRRRFLFSLSAALPLLNCASLPQDSTRRAGGVGDSTTGSSTAWRPEPTSIGEKPLATSAPKPEAGDRYTCPMHPEVDEPKPGVCPKCGMDLVLKKKKG